MGDWVRGVNRLRALLASISPSLERAFDYSTRSPLILLTGFQTPARLRGRRRPGRGRGVPGTEHGAWGKGIPAMVDKALDAAGEQTVVLADREGHRPADRPARGRPVQHGTADQDLGQTTHRPVRGTRARQGGDHQPPRVRTDPGCAVPRRHRRRPAAGVRHPGPARGLRRARPRAPRLWAGQREPAPARKQYHRGLRRVFYLAAFSSIRSDGPSKTFYQRKRAEGKIHTQALIALARRLIDVIWALIRDNRTFTTEAPTPMATAA